MDVAQLNIIVSTASAVTEVAKLNAAFDAVIVKAEAAERALATFGKGVSLAGAVPPAAMAAAGGAAATTTAVETASGAVSRLAVVEDRLSTITSQLVQILGALESISLGTAKSLGAATTAATEFATAEGSVATAARAEASSVAASTKATTGSISASTKAALAKEEEAAARQRDIAMLKRWEAEQENAVRASKQSQAAERKASKEASAAALQRENATRRMAESIIRDYARIERAALRAAAVKARMARVPEAADVKAPVARVSGAAAAVAAARPAAISGIQTAGVANAVSGLKAVPAEAKKAFDFATRSSRLFERQLFSVNTAIGTTTQLLFGLSGILLFRGGIETIRNFEREMAGVRAVTQATAEEISALSDLTKRLSISTGFAPEEAARGLKLFAQAGFDVKESTEAMAAALDLATIGEIDLDEAVSVTTRTIRGFGLAAKDARDVADTLAKASVISNITIKDLGESLKFAAPAASALGTDFKQVAAALVALGDAGQRGSLGGTGLRRVLSGLASPTKEARAGLRQLAEAVNDPTLTFSNLQKQIKTDLIGTLERLRPILGNAGLAFEIFNDRGGTALLALAQSLPKLRLAEFELARAAGESKRMAEVMRNTLDGAIKRMVASFKQLAIEVGNKGALGSIRALVEALTVLAGQFGGFSVTISGTSDRVRKLAKDLDLLFNVIVVGLTAVTVVSGIGAVARIFGALGRGLGLIRGGTVAWKAALEQAGKAAGTTATKGELIAGGLKTVAGNSTVAAGTIMALKIAYDLLADSSEKANASMEESKKSKTGAISSGLEKRIAELSAKTQTVTEHLREVLEDAKIALDTAKSQLESFEATIPPPNLDEAKWKEMHEILQSHVDEIERQYDGIQSALEEASKRPDEPFIEEIEAPEVAAANQRLQRQIDSLGVQAAKSARQLRPMTDVEREMANAADDARLAQQNLRLENEEAKGTQIAAAESAMGYAAAMEQSAIALGDYFDRLRDLKVEQMALVEETNAMTDTQKAMSSVSRDVTARISEMQNSVADPKARVELEALIVTIGELQKKSQAIETLDSAFTQATSSANAYGDAILALVPAASSEEQSSRKLALSHLAVAEAIRLASREGLTAEQIQSAMPNLLSRVTRELADSKDGLLEMAEAQQFLNEVMEGALTPAQRYEQLLVKLKASLEALGMTDVDINAWLEANPRAAEKLREMAGKSSGFLSEIKKSIESLQTDMDHLVVDTLDNFASASAQAFIDFASGAENAGDAFRQFGLSVISTIVEMMVKWAALQAVGALLDTDLQDQGLTDLQKFAEQISQSVQTGAAAAVTTTMTEIQTQSTAAATTLTTAASAGAVELTTAGTTIGGAITTAAAALEAAGLAAAAAIEKAALSLAAATQATGTISAASVGLAQAGASAGSSIDTSIKSGSETMKRAGDYTGETVMTELASGSTLMFLMGSATAERLLEAMMKGSYEMRNAGNDAAVRIEEAQKRAVIIEPREPTSQLSTDEQIENAKRNSDAALKELGMVFERLPPIKNDFARVLSKGANELLNASGAYEYVFNLGKSAIVDGASMAARILQSMISALWAAITAQQTASTVGTFAGLALGSGGIVTKPTTALVAESGPEAVIPLDRLTDSSGSGFEFNLSIVNESGTQLAVRQQNVRRMGRRIDGQLIISEAGATDVRKGGQMDREMKRSYGVHTVPRET